MQGDLFRKSAVVLEQNLIEANLYSDILSANGFDVYIASSPMDALVKLRESNNDLVIIDLNIAGHAFMNKFLKNIRQETSCKDTTLLGLSMYEQKEKITYDVDFYLTKPCSIDKFIEVVFGSLEQKVYGCECFNNQ